MVAAKPKVNVDKLLGAAPKPKSGRLQRVSSLIGWTAIVGVLIWGWFESQRWLLRSWADQLAATTDLQVAFECCQGLTQQGDSGLAVLILNLEHKHIAIANLVHDQIEQSLLLTPAEQIVANPRSFEMVRLLRQRADFWNTDQALLGASLLSLIQQACDETADTSNSSIVLKADVDRILGQIAARSNPLPKQPTDEIVSNRPTTTGTVDGTLPSNAENSARLVSTGPRILDSEQSDSEDPASVKFGEPELITANSEAFILESYGAARDGNSQTGNSMLQSNSSPASSKRPTDALPQPEELIPDGEPETSDPELLAKRNAWSVVRQLGSDRPEVVQASSLELRRRGWTDDLLNTAFELARGDTDQRKALLTSLEQSSPKQATPWLLWMAQETDADLRYFALQLLLKHYDPSLALPLRRILNSEPDERIASQLRAALLADHGR